MQSFQRLVAVSLDGNDRILLLGTKTLVERKELRRLVQKSFLIIAGGGLMSRWYCARIADTS